jgi:glycosyltransferase involved in cell wall biosynthesis
MTATPAVSIVIPLFNGAQHIAITLRSALTQTFPDFEIILIDDGSTDGGLDLVRERFRDSRLVLIRQENAGVAAARNRAMAEAQAPLVAFLDADDVWAPEHLSHLTQLAARFPSADLVGNAFRPFTSAPDQTPGPRQVHYALIDDYFARCAAGAQPFYTSSCMVRRGPAMAVGGFAAGHSRGEDLALWIKLAAVKPVAVSDYVGCWYRRSASGLTGTTVREPDISMRTLEEMIANRDDWSDAQRQAAREFYNRLALAHALDCGRAGDTAAARSFLNLCAGTIALRRRWLLAATVIRTPPSIRRLAFWVKDRIAPAARV